jgi:DNA-directed RNA polymerase subunit RPC12/RpoP
MKPLCKLCGSEFSKLRFHAGYVTCLTCGEREAVKRKHTIAPMHKSNYLVITNLDDLKGLNNKGGKHNGI